MKSKEHSNRTRAICILKLLLESEEVGVLPASKLAAIAWTDQTNNRVKLGWCIVVREIVQAWSGSLFKVLFSPLAWKVTVEKN